MARKKSLFGLKSHVSSGFVRAIKAASFFSPWLRSENKKNDFSSLLLNSSNLVSPADVKNKAVSFFKKLFKEDHQIRPTFENMEFKKLLLWQIENLNEAITHDEIDSAVASCDSQKSPGLDSFNFFFIKNSWDVIKHDFYEIVENFWATGSQGCNTALVALIAKVESPTGFKDFMPISIIGCIYKIISKLLVRRLQKVMNHLIGSLQSSFIQGRQILDGALVASELIDSLKRSKEGSDS